MSVWLPLTAYLASALVTPTVANGEAYFTTAAGTSAAAEPIWPTTGGSVADGTITWKTGTTFREQLVTGIYATLNNFALANPTLLRRVWKARPGSFAGELPLAYIGSRDATWIYSAGVRQWHATPSVVVVDAVPDGPEAEARMDVLIDGLIDAFTRDYHGVSGTSILQANGVTELDMSDSGTHLLGEQIQLTGDIAEGRT